MYKSDAKYHDKIIAASRPDVTALWRVKSIYSSVCEIDTQIQTFKVMHTPYFLRPFPSIHSLAFHLCNPRFAVRFSFTTDPFTHSLFLVARYNSFVSSLSHG